MAVWDERLNTLSVTDLERVSSLTEISQKLRSYADNKLKGVYHCARCGASVYNSEEKFSPLDSIIDDWPTFRAPISPESIQTTNSFSIGEETTQIACKQCGLFLGTLYLDGKECGDAHENAKERHSILSFVINFIKDEHEHEDEDEQLKFQQAPKDMIDLLLQEKILLTSNELEAEARIEEQAKVQASPLPPVVQPVVQTAQPVVQPVQPAVAKNERNSSTPSRDMHTSSRDVESSKTNKDSEVMEFLKSVEKDNVAKKATKKVDAKNKDNIENQSHLLRNVLIGTAVVGVAVGAYYYFTRKENSQQLHRTPRYY